MAKKLLADLARDVIRPRTKDVLDRMSHDTPRQYETVMSLIKEWVGGECRDKFPTVTTFAKFLCAKKLVPTSYDAVIKAIHKRFPDAR